MLAKFLSEENFLTSFSLTMFALYYLAIRGVYEKTKNRQNIYTKSLSGNQTQS